MNSVKKDWVESGKEKGESKVKGLCVLRSFAPLLNRVPELSRSSQVRNEEARVAKSAFALSVSAIYFGCFILGCFVG